MSKELPIETLESLLDCDFDTGVCVWKERPLHLCHDEHSQKTFNSRFAGKIAGCKTENSQSRRTLARRRRRGRRLVRLVPL